MYCNEVGLCRARVVTFNLKNSKLRAYKQTQYMYAEVQTLPLLGMFPQRPHGLKPSSNFWFSFYFLTVTKPFKTVFPVRVTVY